MAQKLGDFINSLALKAGIASDSPELKSFLADPACQIEIDNKISDGINQKLMTFDAAINNPEMQKVINKSKAEAYNFLDTTIHDSIAGILEDSDIGEIKKTDSTKEKIKLVTKHIEKLKEASKGGTKVEKDAYLKQIEEVQTALKTLKAEKENEILGLKSKIENDDIDNYLINSVSGKAWKLQPTTDKEKIFANRTAVSLIREELAAKGYKVISENGIKKLVTNDNLKALDANHNEIALHGFIDGAIAQLIAPVKTDPDKSKLPGGGGQGRENNGTKHRGTEQALSAFAELEQNFAPAQ